LTESLSRQNPSSASATRDVSVSLNNHGDVLVAAGDLAGARNHFEESLKIARELARQNPSSASATRDVSVSLVRPGVATKEIAHLRPERSSGFGTTGRVSHARYEDCES
jgi:hypothetical protein